MQVALPRSVVVRGGPSRLPARHLALIAVLLASTLFLAATQNLSVGDARWPTAESVYAVDGWTVGPARVDVAPAQFRIVSRSYARATGAVASLALWSSSDAKRIYRAGPDVPYVNAGFVVESADAEVGQLAAHRGALLLRRGTERWLELHAYGERRGLLGTDARAWLFVGLDSVFGRPNDYYAIHLMMPLGSDDPSRPKAAMQLMDSLVTQLTAWYAAVDSTPSQLSADAALPTLN